jgi:hypothetical protein
MAHADFWLYIIYVYTITSIVPRSSQGPYYS